MDKDQSAGLHPQFIQDSDVSAASGTAAAASAHDTRRTTIYSLWASRYGVTGPAEFQPYRANKKLAKNKTASNAQRAASSAMSATDAAAAALPQPSLAVRALNNLTYGATAASIAEFNGLGADDAARLTAFVDQQLNASAIDDGALDARLAGAGYTTLGKSLSQLWEDHVKPDPDYSVRIRPAWEVQRAAFVRAAHSKRQLFEVVVNFWHDHFNATATDFDVGPVYAHYTRDVIRQNALGNFRAMLEAVAQSTSMLYYLDNASNTRAGPNENYARELLELHTFGAENYLGFVDPLAVPAAPEDPNYPIGYTDIDVYETATAFTGWSVKDGHWQYPNDDDGTFVYRSAWHDSGLKYILGKFLNPEQPALKDGRDVLDRAASHPRVAKYIAKKLIRRFVTDAPPQELIDSAAAVFRDNWQSPDQIKLTLRHILLSDTFVNAWGGKSRRPFELVVAAMRALGSDWTLRLDEDRSDTLMWLMQPTGHVPYDWPAPNGYPDIATAWSGSNSYAMSWRLLNWLTEEAADTDSPLAPVVQTTRGGVAQWTANNLVDFWCQRILGYLPTAERRQLMVNFMAQNGDPATFVIADTDAWAADDLKNHYNQQRLRSMVSMILLSPEFMSR